MNDNFSPSDQYAKYRPTYPKDLFDFLNDVVEHKNYAWDCGTGNGQLAFELSKTFGEVFATDISQSQIDNSFEAKNIVYSVQPAEHTNFNDEVFDLIIVGQAIHWFDFDKFYSEVNRTLRPDGVICVVGYGKIEVSDEIDEIISDLYTNVLGSYWEKERRYVEENYQTIPFPFDEIELPEFANERRWELDQLVGYLNTWSAVKHFMKVNGYNPVDKIKPKLKELWGTTVLRRMYFPMMVRMGVKF
jgi:SAM-dependent methyltransferase